MNRATPHPHTVERRPGRYEVALCMHDDLKIARSLGADETGTPLPWWHIETHSTRCGEKS